MTRLTPPYFFDEFLRPVRRKQPTERERALGLSLRDLDWLHKLYYATDEARQSPRFREAPMAVEKLMIHVTGKAPIPLAGAFMMSPGPEDDKAVLYTPYAGLEVFDNRGKLLENVTNNLKNNNQNVELTRFISIRQRADLANATDLKLVPETITGAVLQDQENTLAACQQQNVREMLDQLRTIPTLPWMLDTLLSIMSRSYFPDLDHRDSLVNSFAPTPHGRAPHWVSSVPLSEALLQFYLSQGWPAEQTRRFVNPRHVTQGFTEAQRVQDVERWQSLVEQCSAILSKLLGSLLQTYWNEDFADGQSRIGFFAQVLSDKFRTDLLLKRQNGIISAQESHVLQGVFLPDQATRKADFPSLRVQTVRIHAPYQHYVELAGTLLINQTHAYLYTQTRGLQVLKDMDDLNETLLQMLKTAGHEDELLNFLSLDERNDYIGMNDIQIIGLEIKGNVFSTMIEAVSAKQQSNMEYALGMFRRSDGNVDLTALLDCALDVRQMTDQRLLALDAGGRWSMHPVTSGNGRPSTVQAERAKAQLQALLAADALVRALYRDHPTLRKLAAHTLNAELEKHQRALEATSVFFNTYASQAQQVEERTPEQSLSMVEHFIERLAGTTGPIADSPLSGFYTARLAGYALRFNNLDGKTFNAIVESAMGPFVNHDIRTLPRHFLQQHQKPLNDALLLGLRSEAELRLLYKTLARRGHDILDTVLRPDSLTRLTRHGLDGFLPDAYGLTVLVGEDEQPQALANGFVLTERGGTDPVHSGQAVLWTPRRGHEVFASIQAARHVLEQRLAQADERFALLENLAVTRRTPHQRYRLGPLQRIDGHLLDNRQESWRDFVLDGVDYLLSIPLGARRLQDCLDSLLQRPPPNNLSNALAVAHAMIHQQALPVWLGMAAPREQILHAELLEQYRVNTLDERDYLHSLEGLREYVARALAALLDKRLAGQSIDPDNVLIAGRARLDGHALSLVDFAMDHLPELSGDNLRPYSRTATSLPTALDGAAVVQLVRQLDLATHLGALLNTHLSGQSDEARQRQALFCRQLPWQLLRHAHEEKLEERLSATAWSFVQQVFDMPDALAREAVSGTTAMIRPLELIATAGAVVVKPLGLYLIGPQSGATGPLVLYAPYSPLPVLREYAREQDLLDELERPGPLQDWVIRRLDVAHQSTYRHLLQPRTPMSGVDLQLASTPIRGNHLTLLFDDNTRLLVKMLACQFDPDGKGEWDTVTDLLRKAIPTALQFIAGKLSYPLVVWRSFKLFMTSAEDLQQHRWGSALKNFIRGAATLASLRKELDALLPADGEPAPAPSWSGDVKPTATTLATLDVTEPLRTRMQRFEQHDIALADLTQSPLSHVFQQPGTLRHFVPVAGKVYPVRNTGDGWCVSLDEVIGPFVQRDAEGRWVLDLSRHDPRFGKTLSRYAGRRHTRAAERESINIEAVGMEQIAALSNWKAQCINEALNVATYYTVNCKRNVVHFADERDPASRLGRFFNELFGVITLTPEQLRRVEQRVDEVLNELVNPSLCKPDSGRFVIGNSRWRPSDSFAFVLLDDIEQKIYLLERFFDPQLEMYEGHLTIPFSIAAHARATVLIHELTHLMSRTEDVAYLDTVRPFQDLIDVSTDAGKKMHTKLSHLRDTALSVLTPASLLFLTFNEFKRRWEEAGHDRSTASIRDKIFKMTGAKTLDDARQIFMSNVDKRIDTILANADSVTYLIMQLGRELDQGA